MPQTNPHTTQIHVTSTVYVGRLHSGDETRVQTHDCCAAPAGRVQRITRPKARLVFEEVTLVYGLVECSIALLPHLLLAASPRDEVEATTRSKFWVAIMATNAL